MVDLTTILINLSNSLLSVQKLLSGMGYLFGTALVISGLFQLKKAGQSHGGGGGEGLGIPLAYIIGGSVLIYLPTTFEALSNTVFGANNILSYGDTGGQDLYYNAVVMLIETAGLVWFLRGVFLLIESGKPNNDKQEMHKGMTFLIAGICAMNFESTMTALNYTLQGFFTIMTTIKNNGLFQVLFTSY